ncbi:hypothetical protein C8R46DRAFT_93428 [Mycena filopes]|nr:hypothetical protein C8R46DRAFT_93428 [Mycena filopes]
MRLGEGNGPWGVKMAPLTVQGMVPDTDSGYAVPPSLPFIGASVPHHPFIWLTWPWATSLPFPTPIFYYFILFFYFLSPLQLQFRSPPAPFSLKLHALLASPPLTSLFPRSDLPIISISTHPFRTFPTLRIHPLHRHFDDTSPRQSPCIFPFGFPPRRRVGRSPLFASPRSVKPVIGCRLLADQARTHSSGSLSINNLGPKHTDGPAKQGPCTPRTPSP